MARVNNPVLGFCTCQQCGGQMTVHQMARSKAEKTGTGRFLYSRCPNCGADQRTGAAVQQYLWDHTSWDEKRWPEGFALHHPPGVHAGDEPAAGDVIQSGDPEPVQVDEPVAEPAEPVVGSGWRVLMGMAVFIALAAAGVSFASNGGSK